MSVQDCQAERSELSNLGFEKQAIIETEGLDRIGMQFALPKSTFCCQHMTPRLVVLVYGHRVHYSLLKLDCR